MQLALTFLDDLTPRYAEKFLRAGVEQQIPQGTILIEEGASFDAVHVLLEGVLDVISTATDEPLAHLGPGEILGEVSLLDGLPASASVRAAELCTVLSVPKAAIPQLIQEDTGFGTQFYRALAKTLAQRLRSQRSRIGTAISGGEPRALKTASGQRVAKLLEEIKTTLIDADRSSGRTAEIEPRVASQFASQFSELVLLLDETAGDRSAEPREVRDEIGRLAARELAPYLLLTDATRRCLTKPRGYAGDYLMIKQIYERQIGGVRPIGKLVDSCFMESPTAAAVRNRRGLLCRDIQRTLAESPSGAARVASLACGPAEEVFDVYGQLPKREALQATLIDFDLQALAFVADRREREHLERQVSLVNENLIYLALGRKKLELADQDLIYSIGLIDYFDDQIVIKLLNAIHSMLRPGGRVILGNFHPVSKMKAMMDYVLDWKLTHRTEGDMDRLYRESAFGKPCTQVMFEPEGINLFAECVKS